MRKPLLAALLAGALASGLGGCVSLLPKVQPAQLYRFGADVMGPGDGAGESHSGADKTGVVLATVGFPRASTSDGILTVTGDQTAYIGGVRWVAPARLLFQEAVQRAFERHAARAQIVDVGDVGAAGAILRIDVTSFEARYQRGAPTVVVALTARLTRSDGRVLDQRDFSDARPAGSNSVSAIVKAFDGATDKVLMAVTGWTDAEVATIPASTTPPPPAPPPPEPSPSPPPPPAPTVTTSSSSTSTTVTSTTTPHS
jgi:cholesterol transport system auxiliary component